MQSNLEREAFAGRLREVLARVGDDGSSPMRLAREFNRRYPGPPVTLHATRKWLQGEALPSQDKLRVLAAWLGVTAEWLRFGDGRRGKIQENVPTVDFDLARQFGALTPAHREAVLALVKALRKGETAERRKGK